MKFVVRKKCFYLKFASSLIVGCEVRSRSFEVAPFRGIAQEYSTYAKVCKVLLLNAVDRQVTESRSTSEIKAGATTLAIAVEA